MKVSRTVGLLFITMFLFIYILREHLVRIEVEFLIEWAAVSVKRGARSVETTTSSVPWVLLQLSFPNWSGLLLLLLSKTASITQDPALGITWPAWFASRLASAVFLNMAFDQAMVAGLVLVGIICTFA